MREGTGIGRERERDRLLSPSLTEGQIHKCRAPSYSAHIREPACTTRGTISTESQCFERGVARSIRCPIIFFLIFHWELFLITYFLNLLIN